MRSTLKRLHTRIRQARRNTRAGSVLILVVALLVLMALIGTAFISTSRVDRVTSVQNVNNTQIDLLVEGVKNMAKSTIVGDIMDASSTPRLRSSNTNSKYADWTIPLLIDLEENNAALKVYSADYVDEAQKRNSAFLSPRLPTWDANAFVDPSAYWNTTVSGTISRGAPVWPVLGAPLVSTPGIVQVGSAATGTLASQTLFESPFVIEASGTGTLSGAYPLTYHDRVTGSIINAADGGATAYPPSDLVPYQTTLNYPDGTSQPCPVWLVNTWKVGAGTLSQCYYLAGDADGDGFADCGMWKLPVGQINGITYYAGVRIIENNSAINVNTALSRDWDFNGFGGGSVARDAAHPASTSIYNLGMFPTNIGLAEFLKTYIPPAGTPSLYAMGIGSNSGARSGAELQGINQFRLNLTNSLTTSDGSLSIVNGGTYMPGGIAQQLSPGDVSTKQPTVISDTGNGGTVTTYSYSAVANITASGTTNFNTPVYFDSVNTGTYQARGDFVYTSLGDAMWMQLARSTANPGAIYDVNYQANNTGSIVTCRPFDQSDSMSLAYHFVMANPNMSRSSLEQACISGTYNDGSGSLNNQDSLYYSSPAQFFTNRLNPPAGSSYGTFINSSGTAYNYSQGTLVLAKWFADNFDFNGNVAAGTLFTGYTPYFPKTGPTTFIPGREEDTNAQDTFRSRRSLLTASNPVTQAVLSVNVLTSSSVLSLTGSAAATPSTTSVPIPTYPYTAAPGIPLPVRISSLSNTAYSSDRTNAGLDYEQADMMADPSVSRPKTSINMADFGELWRGFFLTMASGAVDPKTALSPFGGGTLALPSDGSGNIYEGMGYNSGSSTWASLGTVDPSANFAADPSYHPQRMFRSSYRDPLQGGAAQFIIPPDQMVVLRSALAAANAEGIRDPHANGGTYTVADSGSSTPQVPKMSHTFPLQLRKVTTGSTATVDYSSAGVVGVDVTVYPVSRQPYIQEVYANTNIKTDENTGLGANALPYVAIELYNPYPDPIDLSQYKILLLDRHDGSVGPAVANTAPTLAGAGGMPVDPPDYMTMVIPPGNSGSNTIPANGYLMLENYSATGSNGVTHRAPSSALPPTGPVTGGNTLYISNLDKALDHEIVFLRPIYTATGNGTPNGAAGPIDWAPADSYDFTGLDATKDSTTAHADTQTPTPGNSASTAHTWHYVRGDPAKWAFIYPGRYDAKQAADGDHPRQQGTQVSFYLPEDTPGDPADPDKWKTDPFSRTKPVPPVLLANAGVADPSGATQSYTEASYPGVFPFQILNQDQPGPFKQLVPGFTGPAASGPAAFPFGMFARPTDMLQVPFCGSYIIQPKGAIPLKTILKAGAGVLSLTEINPMTIDSSLAEDSDPEDDPSLSEAANPERYWRESVGHFLPISDIASGGSSGAIGTINDFLADSLSNTGTLTPGAGTYGPNSAALTPVQNNFRYHWALRLFDFMTTQTPSADYFPDVKPSLYGPYVNGGANSLKPVPVSNAGGTPADPEMGRSDLTKVTTEDAIPVDGKININTASWRVLSMLRLNNTPSLTSTLLYSYDSGSGEITLSVVPTATDTSLDSLNTKLAKLIAYNRDGHTFAFGDLDLPTQITPPLKPGDTFTVAPHGPYRSNADVMKLKGIQVYLQTATNGTEPDDAQGDFSPFNATLGLSPTAYTDGIRGDYEERLGFLNTLSNTITTRSDTFTVYIVVQGWRNAGSTDTNNPPKLVVQRRAAFLADRSGVTSTNSDVKVTNIPTD